jgi:Fe-S cluster assembly iron-binding protein IscA
VFTVSEDATAAIRQIITRPDIPEGAGLRIAVDGGRTALSIGVSVTPQPGDAVYEVGTDAQLFIAEEAGELLDEKTIDARTDESGQVQFVLDTLER